MKALTGNRLTDGEVVFWKAGAWVERFADAELFESAEAGEAAEAHAKSQQTVIVDPYLIDLIESEGLWAPVSYRERLRALGLRPLGSHCWLSPALVPQAAALELPD